MHTQPPTRTRSYTYKKSILWNNEANLMGFSPRVATQGALNPSLLMYEKQNDYTRGFKE